MMDEDWIGRNIKQRTCVLYSRLAKDQLHCKCLRLPDNHPKGCKNDEASKPWTMERNTVTTDCKTYGDLVFDDREAKFVRMDVESDMSKVKHLLFNIWDLPKPQWLLSVIGKLSDADGEKKKSLKKHIEKLLSSHFAGNQSVWIITDGVQDGVSALVGEAIENSDVKNVTSLGIYSWGFSTPNPHPFEQIDTGKQQWKINDLHKLLPDAPSKFFSHHIFTDDGSFHPENTYRSYQDFKTRMEKHIAESETDNPIPHIVILCGGLLGSINGVRSAIESDTPIIIMKGSGGYADVLVRLLEGSRPKSKPLNRDILSWTGTVSDDELRQKVEDEVAKTEKSPNKSAERILLQCLQKRELLTVLDPEQDDVLLDCIIKSLFESRSDITRLLDFYMPAKIYSDRGTASLRLPVQLSPARNQDDTEEGNVKKYSMLVRFFIQALKLDRADSIEFIIDFDGLPLEKLSTQNRILKKLDTDVVAKREKDRVRPFFKHLFDWSLSNNKQKCALLFWKKGDALILSALQASSKLSKMSKSSHSQRDVLEHHGRLFEGRAIGLVEECFKDNKEHTLLLMERQSTSSTDVYADSYLHFALDINNRRIFSAEAFHEYMRRVWIGDINPYRQGSGNTEQNRSTSDAFWRVLAAPRTKFTMSVIMYITYLLLFAYTLVVELKPAFSPWEGVVGIWWFGLVFEECRQILSAEVQTDQLSENRELCTPSLKDKVKAHFNENFWNFNDVLCLTTFFIGAVFLVPVHIDQSQLVLYDVARFFLSVDIVFATLRTIQFLAASKFFGSILEMIWKNMQDMLLFLVIIMISVVAEGFGVLSLLKPNSQLTGELFLSIFRYPFWYIFGELFLDEVEASEVRGECTSNPLLYQNDTLDRCPSHMARIAVPAVMGVYMVLMNVLLLNIVIARFSYTFQLVHEQAVWVAAVHGAKLTLEYFKRPPVPSPLNLIYHPFQYIYRCTRRCSKGEDRSGPVELEDMTTDTDLGKWERSVAEYYLANAENVSGKELQSTSSLRCRRHGNRENAPHDLSTVNEKLSRLLEMMEDLQSRQCKLEDSSETTSKTAH